MYVTSINSTTYSSDHLHVYQLCKALSQGAIYRHIVKRPLEDIHLHVLL